ncbi:proline dehydrogenase family protein [Dactylosporangium sp. AC04546]|uniref:proline dehydrogenase family protein n=1 Tax=Dactylosporangium sp. AC04546 TaxID=2862460 RepID=UPI001EDF0859|nr:proline dehydrogenase family protein [Dactylosporangium sp. AC04546]WVK80671.1 proline dehydrogenase family protein [Dactylosporangium sp. AC04546]
MLGPVLLRASRSTRLRSAVEANGITRKVVNRFVAGEEDDAAVTAARHLHARGLTTTLDFLGEDVTDHAGARAVRDRYLALLLRMHEAGAAEVAEVSVKLSALGQALPGDGHTIALSHVREICVAAEAVACQVTLDMEDHTTVDSTLEIAGLLRSEFPTTGTVLQANLRRTPSDLAALSRSGVRVRLVKGAYREPKGVAHQRKAEVDEAYAHGLRVLMASTCYPMIATHDPVMLREAVTAAARYDRSASDWEIQMLYGVAGRLRDEYATQGCQVRIYVPFGTDWYGYFMRRLAERPANLTFFLRALARG